MKSKWLSLLLALTMLFTMLYADSNGLILPATAAEDAEMKTEAILSINVGSAWGSNAGVEFGTIDVDFAEEFGDTATTKGTSLTLNDASNVGSIYIPVGAKDLTPYKDSDVYLAFYVKLPEGHKGFTPNFKMWSAGWATAKSLKVEIPAGDGWQRIVMPVSNDYLNLTSDTVQIEGIYAENGFNNGDVICFAGAGLYREVPVNLEMETEAILPINVGSAWGSNAGVEFGTIDVDFAEEFGDTATTKGTSLTLNDASNVGSIYIPVGAKDLTPYKDSDVYLAFYVKLPEGHKGFTPNFKMWSAGWATAKSLKVEIPAGDGWQRIVMPVSNDYLNLTSDTVQIEGIYAENGFNNGDVICFAGAGLYREVPANDVDSLGTSIRSSGDALRFGFSIDAEGVGYEVGSYEQAVNTGDYDRAELTDASTIVIGGMVRQIVDFGGILTTVADGELTVDAVDGAKTKLVPAQKLYDVQDGKITFVITAINIPEAHYESNISVCPYVEYLDENGASAYYYGKTLTSSVSNFAGE